MKPLTSEEALVHIKAAAENGSIEFADSTEADQYEVEIDEVVNIIMDALRIEKDSKRRKRYFVSDRSSVSDFVSLDLEEANAQREYIAEKLGLEAKGLIIDIAKKLREKRII